MKANLENWPQREHPVLKHLPREGKKQDKKILFNTLPNHLIQLMRNQDLDYLRNVYGMQSTIGDAKRYLMNPK